MGWGRRRGDGTIPSLGPSQGRPGLSRVGNGGMSVASRPVVDLCAGTVCDGGVSVAVGAADAPETGQAYARAQELWEQLGSPSEFLGVPYGQSRYHLNRGDLGREVDRLCS